MGRLCRHSSTVYLDSYDLEGVLNVLAHRIGEGVLPCDIDRTSALAGAFWALHLLHASEFSHQAEFFEVFDAQAPWVAGVRLDEEMPWEVGSEQD